jgi:hypothetical protein
MSTPTATPRTDDEETPLITNHRVSAETYKRMVDLARELETELAEAKAEAAHYMSVAQKATDDLIQLLADKIRLDGLDAILAENAYRARLGWRWNPAGPDSDFKIHMSQDGKMISIRQALDIMLAARKEARK